MMSALAEWIGAAGLSLLMALVVALFVLAAFFVARNGRDREKVDDNAAGRISALENAISCLQGEIRQWRHIASQLAARQRQLEERQDSIDLRDGAEHAYRMAIKMAQRGARPSELADTCGLTRGEAELLTLMHQRQSQATARPQPRRATAVRKIA